MLRCPTALGLGLGLGLGFVLPAQAVPRSGPAAVEHLDVQYAQGVAHDGRRNALDLYLPGGVDHPPLVVFLHGGGWSAGSKDRYAPLGEGLCARGIACAALNTRMFPFVRPDAMVEDCARAFGFLWSHAGDYGYDPERMFLMGHSAGAHLVSWLALDPSKWALTGAPAAALRGVIALSGIYDARPRHRVLDKIFGEEAAARAAASPALLVGDAAPPFQILWAERDIPGLGLTARAFANQLRRHGGAVETLELAGYDHVDYMRALRQPGGGVLLPHVVDYVERLCRARPAPAPAPAWQHGDVQQRLCDPIVGRLPVELFTPARGAARQWLALAADAGERDAAVALARELASLGGAVAVVDCDGLDRYGDARAVELFTATVQALATPAAALALPRTSPFLGAVGAVGWVVGACPLATSGRLLLGAPAAAAVEHGVLAGARQHGRSATELLQANAAPILLVESAGDPDPERDGAARLARLITRKGDTALDLPAAPVVELMRRTGRDDDLLLPFVAAFLQL